MKRIIFAMAVLFSGLLFCCPKVEAHECFWPEQGFQAFMSSCECEPKKLPDYIISDEDADLLVRVSVCEAGSTDIDAIAYVMQVILNRCFETDEFPATIEGVIFQPKQFSTTKQLAKANTSPEAYAALDSVVFGEYRDVEALYFESLDGKVWSGSHEYLFSYGGHDFYK